MVHVLFLSFSGHFPCLVTGAWFLSPFVVGFGQASCSKSDEVLTADLSTKIGALLSHCEAVGASDLSEALLKLTMLCQNHRIYLECFNCFMDF